MAVLKGAAFLGGKGAAERKLCGLKSICALLLGDSAKLAGGDTGTALDTLLCIDSQGGLLLARSDVVGLGDGGSGAGPGAHAAADALILVDDVAHQVLADLGGALLVHNVGDVLIAEMLHGGHDRVGCSLSQCAQRTGLYQITDLLQLVQILQSALALGDLGENFQHTAGADAAGVHLPQDSSQINSM